MLPRIGFKFKMANSGKKLKKVTKDKAWSSFEEDSDSDSDKSVEKEHHS